VSRAAASFEVRAPPPDSPADQRRRFLAVWVAISTDRTAARAPRAALSARPRPANRTLVAPSHEPHSGRPSRERHSGRPIPRTPVLCVVACWSPVPPPALTWPGAVTERAVVCGARRPLHSSRRAEGTCRFRRRRLVGREAYSGFGAPSTCRHSQGSLIADAWLPPRWMGFPTLEGLLEASPTAFASWPRAAFGVWYGTAPC